MKKPKKKPSGFSWPNDARVAVVMTCLWENWSDGKGPPFSVQTTALRPGTHDRAAMTWGAFYHNGLAWANDIFSGLWAVRLAPRERARPAIP